MKTSFDSVFVFSFSFLFLLGILVLFGFEAGSGEDFFHRAFIRQTMFGLFGAILVFVFSFVNYHYYRSYSTVIFFLSAGILSAVLIAGETIRGTMGWIQFLGVQIQPVEFIKVMLVVFLASFISQKQAYLHEKSRLIASALFTGVLVFLVFLQPDFGSAMLLLGTWGGMMLLSGIRKRYFAAMVFLGIIAAGLGWFFLKPYQQERLLNVFRPETDIQGHGYNVAQALVAIGSGGWFGKGIGYGSQSQLNFLPEKHTDFIFASLVETLGFFGGIILFFGMVFFLYRIMSIARRARDNFGYMLACGFFVMFSLQSAINIGMNMGVFPVTGIPLPFLSYGGSSLISSCIACGILLNISKQGSSFRHRSFDREKFFL